jgi:hypothetical protein
MKDELKGQWIDKAYFLGIKQYGYYYHDKNNQVIEKSVFAGVPRDSLTFENVKTIFNGGIIEKNIPIRFYKSFNSLNITIKNSKLKIKMNSKKRLVNNRYTG